MTCDTSVTISASGVKIESKPRFKALTTDELTQRLCAYRVLELFNGSLFMTFYSK